MANNVIKLEKPIKVNNAEVFELPFDFTEITSDLYMEACIRSSRVGNQMNAAPLKETNEALILCFGKAAIIAANSTISWEDLDRVKGRDLLFVSNIGRFFITGRPAESLKKALDEQSEDTASDSTQA